MQQQQQTRMQQQDTQKLHFVIPLQLQLATLDGKNISKGKGTDECMISVYSKNFDWIIDSGATDHMTFSQEDLVNHMKPRKNRILNANGDN